MDDEFYKDDFNSKTDQKESTDLSSVQTKDDLFIEEFLKENCHNGIDSLQSPNNLHIINIFSNIYKNIQKHPKYSHLCGELLLDDAIPQLIMQQSDNDMRFIGYKLYIFIIEQCPDLFNIEIAHQLIEITKSVLGADEELNHCCWDLIKTVLDHSQEEKKSFIEEDGLNFAVSAFLECEDISFTNQIASIIVTFFDDDFEMDKENAHKLLYDIKEKISITCFFCQFITNIFNTKNDVLIIEFYRTEIDQRLFSQIVQLHKEYNEESSDITPQQKEAIIDRLKAGHLIIDNCSFDYDINGLPIVEVFDFATTGSQDISLEAFQFIYQYIVHFKELAITNMSQKRIIEKLNVIYDDQTSSIKNEITKIILECFCVSSLNQMQGLLMIIGLHKLIDFAQTENDLYIDKLAFSLQRMIDYQLCGSIFIFWNDEETEYSQEDTEIIDKLIEINEEAQNELLDIVIQELIEYQQQENQQQPFGDYYSSSDSFDYSY